MRVFFVLLCIIVTGCATGPTEISGERWQGEIRSFKECFDEGEPWFNETPHKIKVGVTQDLVMFGFDRDEHKQVASGPLNPDGSFVFWYRITAPDTIYGKRLSTGGFRRDLKVEGQVSDDTITGQMFLHHQGVFPGCGGTFILTRN